MKTSRPFTPSFIIRGSEVVETAFVSQRVTMETWSDGDVSFEVEASNGDSESFTVSRETWDRMVGFVKDCQENWKTQADMQSTGIK